MSSTRPRSARKSGREGMVNTLNAIDISDEDVSEEERRTTRTSGRKRQDQTQYARDAESESEDDEDDEQETRPRRGGKAKAKEPARRSTRQSQRMPFDDSDPDLIAQVSSADDGDEFSLLQSDLPGVRKRTRKSRRNDDSDDSGRGRGKRQRTATRKSSRQGRYGGGMEEKGMDDIERDESEEVAKVPSKPKPAAAKEIFKQLSRSDEFRMRHNQHCEVCTNGPNFAPLVYCQGCTLAYHKQCLGHRTNREHLVTKVDDNDFALQCRRCVAWPKKKDPAAPDQGKCQDCLQYGASCRPFRPRKAPAQEQREREENDGEDPSYVIEPERINNADNVLFRCINCWRGFHFEHLPSRTDMMDLDTEADVEQRFREYSRDWKCKECLTMPAKVSGIVAWKPTDEDNYDDAVVFESIPEDEKAYLVRWEGQSYFRACWMPGAWVWGVTAVTMRKAFGKKEENQRPKMRTEEAIPEDFLRTDIVLDIKFTSIVDIRTEDIDKARIREVDKALIKYKGLGYEDAVWEKPPTPEDGDRWTDFVTAYNDWVLSRYVRPPRPSTLKPKLEKARKQDFSSLEKQTQPDSIKGGDMMKYQMEGLNWLYYKWFTQKNAILADEMGLGKTIQIIGFLATLVQDWNCFPFLVVVPNSTCPNWRREIKRWAPGLRVVAFYGNKDARDLAYRYEMFPENSKDLRCHVIVTSYDAAADDGCRKFFRGVQWQGLIVDEGQRLKSEKTQLYGALGALKAPFKILLTGTPLQNNQRELFNLLQFLDDDFNAEELAEEYAELDQEKITKLHDMIRPFFLRRTKAQVLTFLPPMAQIILPVSMSVLQKKVYRTILAKNPDLMRAVFNAQQNLGKNEKGSLSNILMQLRKCLCHPFVYSKSIEERSDSRSESHRSLVDASSKLKLLEILLPKLQELGHRVLIFSQFLDMLDMVEDFLDGMEMQYQRLDGQVSSLQKQKRIDEFNDPESSLFAFLLSTRAGGVGINLATADTVIILDPDFNPHQDIQALSRAHRIGQTKKVLCFQLVTRISAEEKIMQIGRKKLALDHVLIQEMDADDANDSDLASVLRHGANELFGDSGEQDIVYDNASIDRLLDRSHMEDTQAGGDRSAETQFSHARVWANDSGALEESNMVESEEQAPDPGVWANILKERERIAAEEAAAKAEAFGRGRRARTNVDYAGDKAREEADGLDISPLKVPRKSKNPNESDTDFQNEESEVDAESGAEEGENDHGDALEPKDWSVAKQNLGTKKPGKKTPVNTPTATPVKKSAPPSKGLKAGAMPAKGAKSAALKTSPAKKAAGKASPKRATAGFKKAAPAKAANKASASSVKKPKSAYSMPTQTKSAKASRKAAPAQAPKTKAKASSTPVKEAPAKKSPTKKSSPAKQKSNTSAAADTSQAIDLTTPPPASPAPAKISADKITGLQTWPLQTQTTPLLSDAPTSQ